MTSLSFPSSSLRTKNNPRKEETSPKRLLKTWFPSFRNVEQADNQNQKYFKQRQLQTYMFVSVTHWGSSVRTRSPGGSLNLSSGKVRMEGGRRWGEDWPEKMHSLLRGERTALMQQDSPAVTWRVCAGPLWKAQTCGQKWNRGHRGCEGSKTLSPFPRGGGINTQTGAPR